MKSMKVMPTEKAGGRLRSIDALRGIAALGVVLYHTVGPHPTAPQGFADYLTLPLKYFFAQGYVGVFLFFVISGFCIHLQWAKARAKGESHAIDFKNFWKRRLRRLYPPYLIALALYLGLTAYTSGIDLTHFFFYDTVMHLLMLHNLDPHTCYSINGVFWTLAIEEQLYLAYFLLLFVRTRWGWTGALLLCAAARVGWFFLSHFAYSWYKIGVPVPEAAASHWLTWALGALSVEAALGLIKLPAWCRNLKLGIATLLCAVTLSYTLPLIEQYKFIHDFGWLTMHPLWGLGFFIIINHIVRAEAGWREKLYTPQLIRLMAYIGIFSYSLYLTHQLVIMMSWRFVVSDWPPMINALLIVTPASVIFAWVFFRFCERPYMRPPAASVVPLDTDKTTPAQDTVSA
jgi:peptidoglycan/LPS O-acetylase OafA/YrhL